MVSVNTNSGAMIALQQLNKTNSSLAVSQERINTGLKVAGAKDDGAIFAIAQGMRAEVASLGVVLESLDRARSVVDIAISAHEVSNDLLIEMKEKALGASDKTLTTEQRDAYNEDYLALRKQLFAIGEEASFNDVNLLTSSAGFSVLANADGSNTISVNAEVVVATADQWDLSLIPDIETVTKAADAIGQLGRAINGTNRIAAKIGTAAKALDLHSVFVNKLTDSLTDGIGNLVDADLAKESAKLQSLQTKQQLGVQALSIANQSSGLALSFFN